MAEEVGIGGMEEDKYQPLDHADGWLRSIYRGYQEKMRMEDRGLSDCSWVDPTTIRRKRCKSVNEWGLYE